MPTFERCTGKLGAIPSPPSGFYQCVLTEGHTGPCDDGIYYKSEVEASIEIAELRARLDEAYAVYENMEERIDELRARLAELENGRHEDE